MGKAKPRMLVMGSTFPAHPGDGTPEFIGDLAYELSDEYDIEILVPMVPGAKRDENYRGMVVRRFRFFPQKWEDLADGAIFENIRRSPSRLLQVPPFFLSELRGLRKAVKAFSPDIIHAHWIIPQGLVAAMGAAKIPRLLTTLGGDLYALDRFPLSAIMSRVVKGSRAVTVMNEDMAQRAIALGSDPARTFVIPMGANLTHMVEPVESDGDDVRLLFVGRLVPKKGVTYLLQALREMGTGNWKLTIVGDGPERESLEREASGLPVSFVGALDRVELRKTYARSDVIVTPSVPAESGDQDGLPVALLEAMAAGLPAIASDLPGINEAVVDGENGRLVQPGNVRELANALREAIEHPETRTRMARLALKVRDQYSTSAIGERYKELLRRLF